MGIGFSGDADQNQLDGQVDQSNKKQRQGLLNGAFPKQGQDQGGSVSDYGKLEQTRPCKKLQAIGNGILPDFKASIAK